MRRINFSDIGVVVNSMEELEEICMTYTALGISFADNFKDQCIDAQEHNLVGYCIQSNRGDLKTTLDGYYLYISIISYPIRYSIDKLDFAVACQLLMSNQEAELKVHLAQHCKEFK